MEKDIRNTFGERLARARAMRSMSLERLCSAMGDKVSRSALAKYESGKCLPSSDVLISLSSALGLGIDYFFRDSDIHITGIEFRKKSRLGAKEKKAINEKALDKVEKYSEIEELCGAWSRFASPVADMPVSCEGDVMVAVAKVKEAMGVGNDGIQSVVALLEGQGVKVIELDCSELFDGMGGKVNGMDDRPVIVINRRFNVERRRLTCLHELGHFVMMFSGDVDGRERERLCNLFASEMLLSSDVFASLMGKSRHDISLMELRTIQETYGISVDALMYKAMHNCMISENRYVYYRKRRNANIAFRESVDRSVYPNAEAAHRFDSLVYRALASEIITTSKAAELLGITVAQVRRNLELV